MRRYSNKYNAIPTVVDNIRFHSKAEATRYQQLKLLKAAGEIKDFELQPKFEILESYKHPATGKKVKATYYVADFRVTYPNGDVEIEDVKGGTVRTKDYLLKKKMFEKRYGVPIIEVNDGIMPAMPKLGQKHAL